MGIISSPTFAQNFYQCTPCPAGTYAESGQCKSCSAGTFSKGAASSCESCPTGTYSSGSASFCAPCQSKPANAHFTSNATSDSCSWDCDSGFSKSGNLCCAKIYVYKQVNDSSYTLVSTLDANNKTYTINWDSSKDSQKPYIKSTEYHGQNASLSDFSIRDIISTSCTIDTYCNEQSCPSIMSERREKYNTCLKAASITISFNCY